MTAAVLFRVADGRTLLLDEVDTIFTQQQRASDATEALRGILNAGYRRGGMAHRAQPTGNTVNVQSFPVFGAKVLAGIGELPDTVADRCARIHLHRATKDQRVERMRFRAVKQRAAIAAGELAQWVESLEGLADARPSIPDELNDRAADGWEPFFAIADAAGGEWPQSARHAAVALAGEAVAAADESQGVTLLRDIRGLFDGEGVDRFRSADLILQLVSLRDAPWGDEQLNQHRLSRMLKPFGIKPRTIQLGHGRVGRSTPKGYLREQFDDAWGRYLAPADDDEGRQS